MPNDKPTTCAKCAAPFPILPPGHVGGTGYATRPDGSNICYPCADAEQVEELKDRSRPFCGYLNADCTSVTTWTGGHLMQVKSKREKPKRSRFGDRKYAVSAVDVHGGLWRGTGSPHMIVNMKPFTP